MSYSPLSASNAPHPLITVSGFASGVGKTTLAEWLIRCLAPIAALKVTVVDSGVHGCPIQRSCGICPSLRAPYRILIEPAARSHGHGADASLKDTQRLARAGAEPVVWVQTRREVLDAALGEGLERVRQGGVVIEGNTVVSRLQPDLALMVDRVGRTASKPSAQAILDRMHVLLLNTPGMAPGGRIAAGHGENRLQSAALEVDPARPAHGGDRLPSHPVDLRAPGPQGEETLRRLLARVVGPGGRQRRCREAKLGRG